MKGGFSLKVLVILLLVNSRATCTEPSDYTFDDSFKFGIASAAYQVEGAWNESGKGISIWDYYTHNTSLVKDGSNGDIACDSYHKYKEDIELLKQLGVNHYRFSFSWPRILPTGLTNNINQAGIDYYSNFIDELIAAGIEPMITIYHWDLPRTLDHLGGWSNPIMADYLVQYADLLFSLYGDRVKTWITINEPHSFCVLLKMYQKKIDDTLPSGVEEYLCGHNVLRAHSGIWNLYQKKYKNQQKGRIGITLSLQSYFPDTETSKDKRAVERVLLSRFGWFCNPLVFGDYPEMMIERIGRYSKEQGLTESRLPKFTEDEKQRLKGSFDFIGINNYVSRMIIGLNDTVDKNPTYNNDFALNEYEKDSWAKNYKEKIQAYSTGFGNILRWVRDTYKNPEILITEQGYSNPGGINDTDRVYYYKSVLKQLLKSINEDGVNVTGYTVWSLLDDFEWVSGYTETLGLYSVDFNDPQRTRTAKESSQFYKKVIARRSLKDLL
ncbi:hypothetical protein JTB14_037768 [Gonioctena quinquepunctata]|nr:hypothetical protein JTB14_037768 [Gonioctena quinquepunctata]